jgi:hypothetical protein
MTGNPFQIIGDNLTGRGLSFDVATLTAPTEKSDRAKRGEKLAEIAEVVFREGRSSVLLSWDERFDLHGAVDVLRGLAVVVGPTPTGDRHRRMADILARLLQGQEGGA